MAGMIILIGLLVVIIALDLAASRWGVDSTDALNDWDAGWQRRR